MPFDLVIFDCDGVLVDSEPIVNRLFVDMLAELGLTLDYEATLREFSGAAMSTRLDTARQRLRWTAPTRFVDDFTRRLAVALRAELLQGVNGRLFERMADLPAILESFPGSHPA